ncbi:MAG: UvrD-helicase domain-containing protein [Planctomycetes bacterium]|nr:UvrD-helicase domain-containing protein [Planctomycetota bacterium]
MDDPLYQDLNDEQRAAVAHDKGPLMVLAGAGSGKTRVVTRRIARLLRDGVRGSQVLAMTFTNKAAGEMAHRVQQLGGPWVRVATFHSACARFLRHEAPRLGFPQDFTIYDVYDRDSLIKSLLDEHNLLDKGVKPAQVGQQISRLKNCAATPGDLATGFSELARVVERLWTPYAERLQKLGAMDFDDLLLHFLRLLREHPAVAEQYRERFPWVLVDEFQDTNRVQYDLLRQLSPPDGNLCVVGDPDQSIYGFRGAEIRNILDFENDFPTTTVVRLEQNYRSSANILHAAENVIANNRLRKDKRLRTDNDAGEPLIRFRAGGPAEEADAIAGRIKKLAAAGTALDQIAVFYRAHWLSRAIEQSMKDAGLPYVIVGGLTFFERREIKDLLAYLRVLVNPLDDVSMERIINVPPRGFGKASLDKLKAAAAAAGMSLREAVAEPETHAGLPPKARKALLALAAVLHEAKAAGQVLGVHGALKVILDGTDYLAYVAGIGDPEEGAREENIQELMSDVVQFDDKVGEGLAGYLQHVSLLTSADTQGEGPAVQMMTIHAAKGLEFDHVFVAGLEDGVFPSMRALEDKNGIEEERRLMYVALTRGRQTLFLSHVRERMVNGQMERMSPSCFLKEIPREYLREHQHTWSRWDAVEDAAVDEHQGEAIDDGATVTALEPGMRVRHKIYGDGRVRRLSGRGGSRAVVAFDDGIERELILEYAGLRVLDSGGASW